MPRRKDQDELITLAGVLKARPRVREEFEKRLRRNQPRTNIAGHYQRCRENLYLEPHLTLRVWEAVIAAVLSTPEDAQLEQVFAAISKTFAGLVGAEILSGPPAAARRLLGRAASRHAFEEFLRSRVGEDRMGMGGSAMAAADIVRYLQDRNIIDIPAEWHDYPLGQYVMWATFSDDENYDGPFANLPADRRKMRCLLGLPWDDCQQLLFVYSLPADRTPHVPTVAEAYAGGPRKVFFRPPPPGATAGQTEPRDDCNESLVRPEVVHLPVTIKALHSPLMTL